MASPILDEITRLAEELSPTEQRRLIQHLTERLRRGSGGAGGGATEEARAPQDLYGIWRGRFPEDLDVDAILHEIRHEWEEEWPEVFKP